MIDAKGNQLGLIALEDALERAGRDEMDLVEVAPEAEPPVCKIMDFRRHAYEQKQRLKESRKKTKHLELKEIKFRPNIDPHDYGIKAKHVRKFLEKGHKVKLTMRYRMREMRHYDIGTKVLRNVAEELADVADIDHNSVGRGAQRMQVMVLAPKKKSG